ncbi:MAG: bifunctional riboflavin kinase/FAD synthetase [Planctomycetes bacterium]|nr:bifunctional riboflavin kinase/FAD synthetase [Planctomycetota bacterium]
MITSFDRRDLPSPPPEGAVVSIGVFDGVHLGHRATLEANLVRSRALGARSTVVTFGRHPKHVLLGREPKTLTSLEHRLELFRRLGIEHAVVLTFDESLRSLEAERFVREFLLAELGARAFVLGFDSKFGRDRRGTAELLQALGLDVQVVGQVLVGGHAVSSTAIREAVELGDLEAARRMLGRRVSVLGTVVPGDALGRKLGFPTANLDLHHELHPPGGVYACWVRPIGDGGPLPATAQAVANIGTRPTVDATASRPRVEVHVLDFAGDLYGRSLEVDFVARLRGEQRFAGVDELRAQIGRDIEAARGILADAGTRASPPRG